MPSLCPASSTLSVLYSLYPYTIILAENTGITKAQCFDTIPVYCWDEEYCSDVDLSYKYGLANQ